MNGYIPLKSHELTTKIPWFHRSQAKTGCLDARGLGAIDPWRTALVAMATPKQKLVDLKSEQDWLDEKGDSDRILGGLECHKGPKGGVQSDGYACWILCYFKVFLGRIVVSFVERGISHLGMVYSTYKNGDDWGMVSCCFSMF